MNFTIKCDILNRLSSVTKFFKPSMDEELKKLLSSVRLENKNGKSYAISTNQQIASVYFLGETQEPDGSAQLIIDNQIIEQCKQELIYDSCLMISAIPEFALGSARSMLGWEYQGNCCMFPDENPTDNWRDWFKEASANRGFMQWDVDQLAYLAESSPSGKIYFPEKIDSDVTVIIRDVYDDSWCGVFVPKPSPEEKQALKEARKPEWF